MASDITIENYIESNLTDIGYNKTFFEAKTYVGNETSPSLYLISFFYVINYYIFIKKRPTEEQVLFQLKQCRDVNKLNIELSYDGTWNKNSLFNFIKEIIMNIDINDSNLKSIRSVDKFKNDMLAVYSKTVSSNNISRRALYPLFDDVVGLDKAKRAIKERVIDPTLHKEIYEKYNVQVGGGILLFGLPGTGKTMFAQAVANEIDGFFINVKSSDIKSKWYGDTEQRIKEIFDEARKHKVAVIFFDEFEAIGVSRDKLGNEITAASVVPELLNQLQGFQKRDNILLVIAATNRPWDIDSAILRPGRLETLVYVELPNKDARKLMFSKYLNKIQIEEDIIDYLSSYTEGYNGSDIKEICDQLVRIVINKEIDGEKDYLISFEDCVSILKEKKSSVSSRDITNMNLFMSNHKLVN